MTRDEHKPDPAPARGRIGRTLLMAFAAFCIALWGYQSLLWLRGAPDPGGWTISLALALLASADLVRNGTLRWAVIGLGVVSVVAAAVMVFPDVRLSFPAIVALLIILASIIRGVSLFRPDAGVSLAEWKTAPLTHGKRRALCTAMAATNVGAALLLVSIVPLGPGSWPLTLVVAVPALMFIGGGMMLLVLRSRLQA
jgi:hypothetical protein